MPNKKYQQDTGDLPLKLDPSESQKSLLNN